MLTETLVVVSHFRGERFEWLGVEVEIVDGLGALDEAEANPQILTEPEPTVMIDTVTAAGIDMVVRFWISDPSRHKYLAIRTTYFQAVRDRFDREGFEMSPDYLELTGGLTLEGTAVTDEAPRSEHR